MARDKEYFSIRYYFAGEENKIPPALDNYAQNLTDLSDVNRVLELYVHVNSIINRVDKCR